MLGQVHKLEIYKNLYKYIKMKSIFQKEKMLEGEKNK